MEKVIKSLTKNMQFEKGEKILKIKKRHGRFYLASIWDKEHSIEIETLISKSFIEGWTLVEGNVKRTPSIKLSRREIEILDCIEDGDKVTDLMNKFKDLSRSQIAGHVSILDRKGFVTIDKSTREMTVPSIASVVHEMSK